MSLASRKLIQAAAGAAGAGGDTGDDDFANVVLLLDGDGTSGDANNTFTDSSTNGFTVTKTGSVVQGSFSPYGDNWSNYFNDDGYLQVTKSTDLNLDTNNWTIECWLNLKSASALEVVLNFGYETETTRGYLVYLNSDSTLHFAYSTNGSNNTDTSMGSHGIVVNEWTHLAVVRNGSTITGYINGSALGTTINIGVSDIYYPTSGNFRIGVESTSYLAGYMSNMRLVNGTAVYTSNFTPSTSPLTAITNTKLLTCQSNRFQDNSTSSHAISVGAGTPKVTPFSPFKDDDARDITTDGGSGYLASSSDYLSISDNSAFDFGAGDFTIECWANTSSFSSQYNVLISQWGSSSQAWIFRITPSLVGLYANIGGTQTYTASVTNNLNEWNHFAVAREGSSLKFFKDGTLLRIRSIGGTIANATSNITVGMLTDFNPTTAHDGYISDLRVVKGTAVYTSAFTPPTSPLTAITNTELLLNFQDAGIYDRSGINNLDTVGNAQIDTAVKKYGTGSIEFDGSGDDLRINVTDPISFSGYAGDFTAEMWVYPTAVGQSSDSYVWQHASSPTDYSPFVILQRPSTYEFAIYASSNGSSWNLIFNATIGTATANAWHHIAVVRDGTNIKTYMNGTVGSTSAVSTTALTTTSGQICIGSALGFSNSHFTGFIDDLRITKGIARYTADFTPPTAALPKF